MRRNVLSLSRSQLLQIVMVADLGSIGKAATALGIAQPAITKCIQRLEEQCGERLFERSARGMRLTAAGEVLIRHARLIEVEFQNVEDELAALQNGHTGTINIGSGPTWLRHFLPDAIARLHASRPNVSVNVFSGTNDELFPALRQGKLDLVVGAVPLHGGVADDTLTHEPLISDNLVLITREAHPLAKPGKADPARLVEFPWIFPLLDVPNREILETIFRRFGLSAPRPAVETGSVAMTLSLLRKADYVCFQAEHYLASPEATKLVKLELGGFTWRREAGLSYRRSGSLTTAAVSLIKGLRLATSRRSGLRQP